MRRGDYSVNPGYFLAAYTFGSPWVMWALVRGGLVDLRARPPSEDDVLEKETLGLLPKRVRLEPRRPYPLEGR